MKSRNLIILGIVVGIVLIGAFALKQPSITGDYISNDGNYTCPDCNVVIILVDALRFDHLGCYGYKKDTSPNIDKFLCEEGIVFENAITQAPWTKPAVISLFTSNYPNTHNINRFTKDFTVEGGNNVLPSSAITLAETLSDNGYKTKGIIGNVFIKKGFGLEQGFDNYNGPEEDDEVITNKAMDYIWNNKNEKFFLYLHYMATHSPYTPPLKYKIKFKPNYTGTIDFRGKHQKYFNDYNFSKEDLEELRARYDGEINYMDNEIKKLLDYLEEQNLSDKTLVVFVSDHGVALKENDMIGHGWLINTVIQVPLIIVNPTKKAERVGDIVELIDVAPTILSALNIEIPSKFQGINILEKEKKFGYSESRYLVKIIRTKNYIFKIDYQDSESELYDLGVDPFEFKDIKDAQPEVIKEFMEANDLYKKLPKQNLDSREIDQETLEQLKTLGYLN